MNRPDLHVNDYGTPFEITVLNRATNKPVPLMGALSTTFIFKPPEGTSFTRTAELVSPPSGADGKLQYIFEDGDITEVGLWKVQTLVEDADGQWHSDIETFEVGENIDVEEVP